MCLYPKLIKNPKYKANKKNGGVIPPLTDERVKYVPIGCQNCMECRKQKSREWQVRLLEDIKTNTNAKFITLTLSNESYSNINQEIENIDGYARDNLIATIALRRFLERWRKKYTTSLRHWLVTELGHNGTENIHMHGIIWTNENLENVEQIWKYGYVWTGKKALIKMGKMTVHKKINYVNARTVNYIVKYVSKIDFKHSTYKSKILTSAGIGRNYTNTHNSKHNIYLGTKTNETYRTPTGHKIALPIYWRNKIYDEKQRENLWLQKIDKKERWINGERISIKNGEENYFKLLQFHQAKNMQLGYGNDQKDWNKEQYEKEQRNLNHKKRLQKVAIKKKYNNNKPLQTITINNQLWYLTENGLISQAYNNNQRQIV